jgi:hypothetical protein
MKKSPFELSNRGEKIDENFFNRLKRFESYYENHSSESPIFESNHLAIKGINEILQEELLSIEDILRAIEIYNQANVKPHHNGTGWFDLRLHLRHIAFVYGREFETDKEFNLIEK